MTYEAQLSFEDTVQQFAVLATIAVVRSLIRAHNASGACFQTVHEREDVKLVDCAVVDVGAHSFAIRARVTTVLLKS
jgi:photosystem II stability/assembly factor-like uncharacterized protein